jgi:hypothetical protein
VNSTLAGREVKTGDVLISLINDSLSAALALAFAKPSSIDLESGKLRFQGVI